MTWISNYLRSHRVPGSIVFYAFYLVIAVLALFVGLVIWRQSLLVLIYGLLANDDVARLVYVAAMLVLSLGLLGRCWAGSWPVTHTCTPASNVAIWPGGR